MINGILNIYKEAGFTSHDVVAKLRGILHQKKIGHTGTLDPDAVGVLPVCLGKATKVCGMLTDETKTYRAELILGIETDTQDMSGTVLAEKKVFCTEEEVREAAETFLGDQMQIPPMYSALKQNGKRLYELAREGKIVERKPRPVHFYEIHILEIALPRVSVEVTCSKGTYIRTFCHDLGRKLCCGAAMSALERTRVGSFCAADARRLDEIREIFAKGELSSYLIPTDQIFGDLPAMYTTAEGDRYAWNGNAVPVSAAVADGKVQLESAGVKHNAGKEGQIRLYDSAGNFVGIFARRGSVYRPVQMFLDKEAGKQA